ncbi:unnamed protein product, partial [Brassica rapa]
LCVLNRQPTWAKITQTVHGKGQLHMKGQLAESKDQRADMCTDGQPRTSFTDVLCVLTDTHGRPVCADGQPRTSCPTWAKITQTVHGKGQRAESRDQRADMCTDGQPRTSFLCVLNRQPMWAKITQTVHEKGQRAKSKDQHSPRGPKSLKQSTGRASVLSPRTSVLIYVLMDSHGRHVCADGHTWTYTDVLYVRCVLKDTHGRPVCADGHPRTTSVCWRTPTDVLCVLNRQPTWAKITQIVHGKGQRASTGRASVLSPRTNVLICTHTDSQNVLCVLMDTHGCPVCADGHTRTSCTPTDVLCVLNRQPTWAKITQTVHGKG